MKSKVVVLLAGLMLALVLLTRYFALSRSGVPLGWLLYLGLPITGCPAPTDHRQHVARGRPPGRRRGGPGRPFNA
ncbi:hypothetical protein HMPREF0591_0713 [Mycobacterium parascrofulaceum ATCC BAA-614]|uniref:Uncharacterized protein n=1 Tax=Mycobacterium parascrofulaceum ATCC BAA-614 TaxID=525368 RepID=D5P3G9_9MYCO|nr:hypothetical protein [Mycobacterium malmoense]EFG79366.1 hypothetical protein HMPREF0591_0713 [Mycobacterium parascrofulaceum ATCC BAA-614]